MSDVTENATEVLNARYFLKDEKGQVVEGVKNLFARVAEAASRAEKPAQRKKWQKRFYDRLVALDFLPNSPTLMNAGKTGGQLSACYVLPVADDLAAIFETLKHAALIHQSGGGTGFSFSRLRPKGSRVKSSQGVASGPISFLKIFDAATETIKQGGTRRGANMGILKVSHPDIREFIQAKRDFVSLINFNVSVGVTDEFMLAVQAKRDFNLLDPTSGRVAESVRADVLFNEIVDAAWTCGDPGLVFLDRMNQLNPTPDVGEFESTNPCGEQPLLPYESCNLGSVNLKNYVVKGAGKTASSFDWKRFEADVATYVRFLDNIISVNVFPVKESKKITERNRKIGLGVMGLADTLLMLRIRYDSEAGYVFGEEVMSRLDRAAKRASAGLAKERGAFAHWKGSMWERLGYPKMRNATVSTIAPTGTISIIAGCSSGIEPIFAPFFYRNVLSGARLKDLHPTVEEEFRARGLDARALAAAGKLTEQSLKDVFGDAWRVASEIPVEGHLKMQAVFQRHSDSSVSKTINLPNSATRADVAKAYLDAYSMGCKGITIYRDGSRPTQVLEKPKGAE